MTQDGMRERIARALFEKISLPMHGKDWGAVHSETRDYCRDAADAVLAALAEPTEAMANAGMHHLSEIPEELGWVGLAQYACSTWKAMIGAAR